MNSNRLQQLHTMKMTSEERGRIRHTLEQRMNAVISPIQPTHSSFGSFFSAGQKTLTSALILCIFIVSGVGLFDTSADSLPGQPLYFLKRNITEPIVPLFIFNEEDLVSYQSELVSRRVSEARKLAKSGALTAEKKQDLETSMNQHAQKAVQIAESSKTSTSKVDQTISVARLKGEMEAKSTVMMLVTSENTDTTSSQTSVSSASDVSSQSSLIEVSITQPRSLSTAERKTLGTQALSDAHDALDTVIRLRETVSSSDLSEKNKTSLLNTLGTIELDLTSSVRRSDHEKPSVQTDSYSALVKINSTLEALDQEINTLINEEIKPVVTEQKPSQELPSKEETVVTPQSAPLE